MKVLRPELDGLKKKFGSDQQGICDGANEIIQEAGVNPLVAAFLHYYRYLYSLRYTVFLVRTLPCEGKAFYERKTYLLMM